MVGFVPARPLPRQGISVTKLKKLNLVMATVLAASLHGQASFAAPLIKTIPPQSYNIPAGDLGRALSLYAGSAGILLSFDSGLTQGKKTQGLNGVYGLMPGFSELLKNSGLEVVTTDDGRYQLKAAPEPKAGDNLPLDIELKTVNVRAKRFYEVGPLPGLGLTKEEIPSNVQSITAQEIKNSHSLSITDLMNSKLQSVNVNDYQGNPFQMDVQYRGFTAGPQIGTPQGLSVFFDGIRVNEPFGDVVNWDMVPLNALSGFDIFPGSNPIFGLGTLGGAISMKTKSGFDSEYSEEGKADAEILVGSFNRKQLQLSGGWNNGTIGLFGAGNFFLEDGWRENSPSKVNQVFGKASYRQDKLDVNLSALYVWSDLVGNGLIPTEMYKQDRDGVFTSPDTTENELLQFQLSGSYFVNDNFSITAQVYRRNSKRDSLGADVYTEHQEGVYRRPLNDNEEYTCLYNSTSSSNEYGLPDYYVVEENWGDPDSFFFQAMVFGNVDLSLLPSNAFNQPLPDFFRDYYRNQFDVWKNYHQSLFYSPQAGSPPEIPSGEITPYSNGESSYVMSWGGLTQLGFKGPPDFDLFMGFSNYYYTPDGVKHMVIVLDPVNADACVTPGDPTYGAFVAQPLSVADPNNGGRILMVDGASSFGGQQPGVVEGTPTGVLTNTEIDQITDGASIQFNWNFPKHKFMVGASIDRPSAKYNSGQRLGIMDAQRNVFLAPDQIRDQYAAADVEVHNNDFEGNQLTKSIYASETWSPIETLHITGAMRYNETRGKNKVASRTHGFTVFDISQFESIPDDMNVCIDGVCPTAGYKVADLGNLVNKPETEKFSYYSLNPSLGATWQATPVLNIYGNWAQGTRVPSVIELGCAFDDTPVNVGTDAEPRWVPKSLQENRSCSLPTTLSGDPYLPQIKAQSLDLGLRGNWGDNVVWNLGVYRTDLKDDIYMIGFPGNRSFFDTVGDTRRQGIEAGISAALGKAKLSFNYALTEATFQDNFLMPANDNSSSVEGMFGNYEFSRLIQVKPGDRMPGVPLHNLNATLSYEMTPKWQIGLTAVAHSKAYVRGNENNKHREGVVLVDTITRDGAGAGTPVARQPTTSPGSVNGYVVFNFQTSYQLAPEWRLGLQVNNIFDKEYFNAGRLGRNPFSPSIYGAIGPDGYNHNSSDWLTTNFLAPGAPRAAWISLSYEFDPRR